MNVKKTKPMMCRVLGPEAVGDAAETLVLGQACMNRRET
jgi:hypothetical protein